MVRNKDFYEEKSLLNVFISTIVYTFRWIFLMLAVVAAGLTFSLLIMGLIKGSSLPNTILADMFSYIVPFSSVDALEFIGEVGTIKVLVAGCGYGFIKSMKYILLYIIIDRFLIIYKSVIKGNMFTLKNVKLINDTLPLTFILAFISPVVIFCIMFSTKLFDYNMMDVSGILFICAAYIMKLVFEKGYAVEQKRLELGKTVNDYKVREDEEKMASIKKEVNKKNDSLKTVKKEETKKRNVRRNNQKKTATK